MQWEESGARRSDTLLTWISTPSSVAYSSNLLSELGQVL